MAGDEKNCSCSDLFQDSIVDACKKFEKKLRMKTRRCMSLQPGQRKRPIFAPGEIITCRDTFRADCTLNEFKTRFGGASSQAKLLKLFKSLDVDKDGYITSADLVKLAESRGMSISELDCRAVMTKLDIHKLGSVGIAEFMRCMSHSDSSFLNQMQRTIVGVTREGGTVYKSHYAETARSSRSLSTASSDRSTGNRVRDICEAINSGIDKFRPSTGRLDCFYRNLHVPHRNLPWHEDTRHTVEPLISCDRFDRSGSIAMSDRRRQLANQQYRNTMYRDQGNEVLLKAKEKESNSFAKDLNRIAFKSKNISDYYQRVNRPMCHEA